MQKIYNKLVRDKILEIIKADGHKAVVKRLSLKRFKEEALKKVVEEANELLNAKNREELIKECADLEEVLMAVMEAYKITCGELNKVRNKRKKDRGAFSKRLFLVKTISK